MITLNSSSWVHGIGERLNKLRHNDVLCDVAINGCDNGSQCEFCDSKSRHNEDLSGNLSQHIQCASSSIIVSLDDNLHKDIVSKESNFRGKKENTIKTELHKLDLHSNQYDLRAHSSILAASSTVLYSALESCRPISGNIKTLHFQKIKFSVWEYVLEFIYIGKVNVEKPMIEDLRQAAEALSLQELSLAIQSSNDSLLDSHLGNGLQNDKNCILKKNTNELQLSNESKQDTEDKQTELKDEKQIKPQINGVGYFVHIVPDKSEKFNYETVTNVKKENTIKQSKNVIKRNIIPGFKRTKKFEKQLSKTNYLRKSETPVKFLNYLKLKSVPKTSECNVLYDDGGDQCIEEIESNDCRQNCTKEVKGNNLKDEAVTEEVDSRLSNIDSEGKFSCRTCGKGLKNKSLKILHEASHIRTPKSNTQRCKECGEVYASAENLNAHQCLKNRERISSFKCDRCNKSFPRKPDLEIHSRVHSGEKPYTCQYCSKSFSQKPNMLVHEKVHSNEKKHKCNVCGRTFLRKWGLQEHEKTHSGERPYLCQTCGKSFSKISNLQVHERIHSGMKPYQCLHCPLSFSDPSTYRQHTIIHTSVRAYQCVQCGKQFARCKALKEHERVHTGEKPHVCEICNAKFANTSNLSRHKKFHLKKDKKHKKKQETHQIKQETTSPLKNINVDKPSLNSSSILKTPPVSDLSMAKMVGIQNMSDFLDLSITSQKTNTSLTNTQLDLINVMGNNGAISMQHNGNIINQSASISGILPQEVNLQRVGANGGLERNIVIMPPDARFIEPMPAANDGLNVNISGNENLQFYPYQIAYPSTFNSGVVQANLTFQMPNNAQQ